LVAREEEVENGARGGTREETLLMLYGAGNMECRDRHFQQLREAIRSRKDLLVLLTDQCLQCLEIFRRYGKTTARGHWKKSCHVPHLKIWNSEFLFLHKKPAAVYRMAQMSASMVEEGSKPLPVTVQKPTPYTFDLGLLLANDPNPLLLSSNLEESLYTVARDGAQALLNQLLTTCPIASTDSGVLLSLPPIATALPREKVRHK
jgi:hypothetical protein